MNKSPYPEFIILLVLAALTHFLFLFQPIDMVLDEYHFVNYTESYLQGQYSYDIHPPLGKLILTGAGAIIGLPRVGHLEPYTTFPEQRFTWLRIVPALFGVLLVLAVWLLTKELTGSRLSPFLAGLFVTLENATTVQSRYILLDSMLWFFMFLGLWLFIRWLNTDARDKKILFASLLIIGLAGSVKWTGLGALLAIALWTLLKHRPLPFKVYLIPAVVYLLVFTLHFTLLPQSNNGPWLGFNLLASASGKQLAIKELPESNSLLGQFVETNLYMALGNTDVPAHPAQSSWLAWPIGGSPFWYYYRSSGNNYDMIGFMPNLALWWLAGLAVVSSAILLLTNHRFRSSQPGLIALMLIAAWLANWLPFSFILRPMFAYHYVPALIFGIVLLAVLIEQAIQRFPQYKYSILSATVGFVVTSFILTAPNTFLW